MPASDAADVARRRFHRLQQHLAVCLMSGGHDDHIVARRDVDLFLDVVVVAEDHLLGCRVVFLSCEVLAIVEHRHAEADICQHRHQCPSHMSAAEDVDSSRAADRLDIIRRLALLIDRAAGKPGAQHLLVQLREAKPLGFVEGSHGGDFSLLHAADKPGVLPALQKLQNRADQRRVLRAAMIEETEIHHHSAAADHADIIDLIGCQAERLTIRRPRPEKLQRLLLRNALDRAAADGPERGAVREHRHLRTRASGRRAGRGKNAAKHDVFSAFERVQYLFKEFFHKISSGISFVSMVKRPSAFFCGR